MTSSETQQAAAHFGSRKRVHCLDFNVGMQHKLKAIAHSNERRASHSQQHAAPILSPYSRLFGVLDFNSGFTSESQYSATSHEPGAFKIALKYSVENVSKMHGAASHRRTFIRVAIPNSQGGMQHEIREAPCVHECDGIWP